MQAGCRRNTQCNTAHDILLSKFIFGMHYMNLLEIESILNTNKSTFKIQKIQLTSTWAVGVHKALDTRQLMITWQHHRRNKCPGVHQVTAKIAPLGAGNQKHKCLAQFNNPNEIQLKMYNRCVFFQDYFR